MNVSTNQTLHELIIIKITTIAK